MGDFPGCVRQNLEYWDSGGLCKPASSVKISDEYHLPAGRLGNLVSRSSDLKEFFFILMV